jgi:4-diphosphocytidyl-2-C-methyl-D-erythritol kinase
MRMTRIAPAKINLMLHVVGRLPDNFHHLQSIVTFTHSGDDIVIEKAPEFAITVTGTFAARIPPQQDNIIVKAIQWVNQRYNWNEFYHCHLTKNLPVASGMGGGSSDAAATIAAILHLHKVSLSLPEINALVLDSGMLGADVPLCLAHQLDQGSLLWIDSSGRDRFGQPGSDDINAGNF